MDQLTCFIYLLTHILLFLHDLIPDLCQSILKCVTTLLITSQSSDTNTIGCDTFATLLDMAELKLPETKPILKKPQSQQEDQLNDENYNPNKPAPNRKVTIEQRNVVVPPSKQLECLFASELLFQHLFKLFQRTKSNCWKTHIHTTTTLK